MAASVLAPMMPSLVQASNPCEPIVKSMRAQLRSKAFRSRTVINPQQGPEVRIMGEYRLPDRVRLVRDREETIAIRGKGTFTRRGNQAWQKSPTDVSDVVLNFTDAGMLEQLDRDFVKSDCRLLNRDTIAGKPVLVYQYKVGAAEWSSVNKVWIGAADGLPYKVELISVHGGKNSKSVQIIEYDTSIRIEVPQ